MQEIHPIFEKLISQSDQEKLLRQQGRVYWIYGPSGTGKTTIAAAVQRKLYEQGKYAIVLDGDNLRSGLNAGLGFSTEDRTENIRRAAEVSKILKENGAIVLSCFVCPLRSMRDMARNIIGSDIAEVYVKTSLDILKERDTKGFYKKAAEGQMNNLTGINAEFEEPIQAEIVIATDELSPEQSIEILYNAIVL